MFQEFRETGRTQLLGKLKFEYLNLRVSLILITFTVFVIYLATGIFPFAPFEGDGIAIANGAKQAATSGLGPKPLAYRYDVQSGTYALIVIVHQLTGVTTFTAFSLLSAASSIVFILISAAFLKQLTKYPYALCGIGVLLFQETFVGGYYPNSTVIAAAFTISALYVLTLDNRLQELVLAGVLLGIGVWMRFDVVLISPSVLLLLHRGDWKKTLFQVLIVEFITIVVSLSAIYYSGGSLTAILASISSHMTSASEETPGLGIPFLGSPDIKSHLSFYSAMVLFLAVLGVFFLFHQKKWHLLSIFLIGVIPFYLVYLGKILSPKYMYYLIPFWGIPILSGLFIGIKSPFMTKRITYLSIVVILFMAQYILGLQVFFVTKPYIQVGYPTFLNILTVDNIPLRSIDHISLAVGSGTIISTADGDRLSSGILFAPILYSYNKNQVNSEIKSFDAFIASSSGKPLHFLITQYQTKQLILHILLDRGYNCQIASKSLGQRLNKYVCINRDHTITLTDQRYNALPQGNIRTYSNIENAMSLVEACEIVFLSTSRWELDLFLKRAKDWVKISEFAYVVKRC